MATISTDNFFATKRNESEIKSEILNQYFKAWAGILLFGQKFKSIKNLVYIDLYAGTGYYEDGTPSTPIKILESIAKTKGHPHIDFSISVKTFFNDEKKSVVEKLKENILKSDFTNALKHKPEFLNEPASRELLEKLLNNEHPALTFIDPFGYGYSQDMLLHAIRKWGSDVFMLFNMNRIRSAVMNNEVSENMIKIFGEKRLSLIRGFYTTEKNPQKREMKIIEAFEGIFRETGAKTFKFRINFPDRNQTSHYLILASKHRLAYQKIKEIMEKYSEKQEDGVPMFGINLKPKQLLTMDYYRYFPYSIYKLKDSLVSNRDEFQGKTLEEIYEKHNIDTNYVKENYKKALEELIQEDKATFSNPKGKKLTYTSIIYFN
jgi:three-Cys-motif partner protein